MLHKPAATHSLHLLISENEQCNEVSWVQSEYNQLSAMIQK